MKSTLRHLGTVAAILAVSSLIMGLCQHAKATEQEETEIKARAAEIAPLLDDVSGAQAAPQGVWERFAKSPDVPQIIKNAEGVLKTRRPDVPEDLYKEYYRNGNRTNYQSVFGTLQNRIVTLAVAEKLEDQGRFVDALNDELDAFCDLKSWVLPAHDKDATIYDGKDLYSDLGSTAAGADVAVVVNLLGDKLDPKVVDRVKSEVDRRVLQPYEKAVNKVYSGMWWLRTVNNWSAVCHAGTVVAALNIVDSKERRAFFIAGAEIFSERDFFQGFSDDGYCSEGMAYWTYGFGHYIYLGAAIRNATHGQVDMFRFPKVHAVLDYAPTLEIDKGNYAVFADCSITAKPVPVHVGYLSRLKGYGYTDFEARGLGDSFRLKGLLEPTTVGYDVDVVFAENAGPAQKFAPPIRTEFKDAGVLICRPAPDAKGQYFAIAVKGGNNGELHNHNDVGSYSLILGTNADSTTPDVYVSRDPGGETYTARTFGPNRYDGQLLNSFGHPVPRIAGKLQSTGVERRGEVVSESFEDAQDEIVFDITSAYPDVKTLDKALRTFTYRRASGDEPGSVTVADAISFKEGEKGAIETAIVSFEKEIEIAETADGGIEVKLAGAVVSVSAKDASGAALKLVAEKAIVGENDASVPNKPTRVAFRVDGDVNNATIVQNFNVQ